MSIHTIHQCDGCGLEIRDATSVDLDGWEEDDDFEDLCRDCVGKRAGSPAADGSAT